MSIRRGPSTTVWHFCRTWHLTVKTRTFMDSPSTPTPPIAQFTGVDDAATRLESVGYLPSPEISAVAYLADRMGKPILVEGPAGGGKTDLARARAPALERPLIRLQCYQGVDEGKALYHSAHSNRVY